MARQSLRVAILETDAAFPLLTRRRETTLSGRRNIEALRHLIEAGQKGISSLDHPGLRLSHYIHCLRRSGLDIETVDVRFGDITYGKYVLRSTVLIDADDSDGRAAA